MRGRAASTIPAANNSKKRRRGNRMFALRQDTPSGYAKPRPIALDRSRAKCPDHRGAAPQGAAARANAAAHEIILRWAPNFAPAFRSGDVPDVGAPRCQRLDRLLVLQLHES